MNRGISFQWLGYQITFEPVRHRGFGIIRPNQRVAYHQWMIGFWWCVGIRIRKMNDPFPRWL